MSTSTASGDDPGDDPVDLDAYTFNRTEAAFLARLPVKAVVNWLARGHIGRFGRQDGHRNYWYFSILDIVALSVMHDLCVRAQVLAVSDAAEVAEIVVQAALDGTSPEAAAEAHRTTARPNVNVVVSWDADGALFVQIANIRRPGSYYPPTRSEALDEYIPLRHAHIVIPATALLIDVVLRTQHLRKNKVALADA